MKHILQGIKFLNFENDKNKRVVGTQIFTTFKASLVDGFQTGKYFLSTELAPKDLSDYVGCEIDVEFNEKGKVSQVFTGCYLYDYS